AACLRWMVKHQKRPYRSPDQGLFIWFHDEALTEDLGDHGSDIPAAVYSRLAGGQETANHKSYPTLLAAEVAFCSAWVAATQEGWGPGSWKPLPPRPPFSWPQPKPATFGEK